MGIIRLLWFQPVFGLRSPDWFVLTFRLFSDIDLEFAVDFSFIFKKKLFLANKNELRLWCLAATLYYEWDTVFFPLWGR